MGVGYYVSAGNSPLTDHGHFLVAAGVANERVDEVIRAILAEFRKMKDDLVGEKELIKVKEHMVGTMYLGLETSDSFAVHYGGQEVHHCQLRTPEEDKALIRAVTAEEVREMARRIFVKKNLNLALVGPFTDSDALKKLLKF